MDKQTAYGDHFSRRDLKHAAELQHKIREKLNEMLPLSDR